MTKVLQQGLELSDCPDSHRTNIVRNKKYYLQTFRAVVYIYLTKTNLFKIER